MSFVAVAVGTAVAGVGSSLIQAEAAGGAAATQSAAADRATELQREQFERQRADIEPWRRAGIGALGRMQDPELMREFRMEDYREDPGYQFRMQEGQRALERSAAARGGLQSGATLKALQRYGQQMGAQEFGAARARFRETQADRWNRLASLAGVGQTATTQLGQAGQQFAGQTGQNIMSAANVQAAAQMQQAQAAGQALTGLASLGVQYAGYQGGF